MSDQEETREDTQWKVNNSESEVGTEIETIIEDEIKPTP